MWKRRVAVCSLTCMFLGWGIAAASADDPSTQGFTPDELDQIETLTTGTEQPLRISAARQLGTSGDPHVLDILAETLADKDEAVRLAAIKALADLGTTAAIYTLQTAANNPDQPLYLRAEACSWIGRIASRRKTEPAIVSLLALSQSSIDSVRKTATVRLTQTVGSYDASTLRRLSQSPTDEVQSLAGSELARRGGSGAGGDTETRTPEGENTIFTAADMKILNDWRKPQAVQLSASIRSYSTQLSRYRATSPMRQTIRKKMGALQAALIRMDAMSPVELGAAMLRQAQTLSGQSANMHVASKFVGEVSKEMAQEPGEQVDELDGYGNVVDSYYTDNTGPALLGMLLAIGYNAQASSMKAEASHLEEAFASLSPSAQKAITDRLAQQDAQH